MENEKDYLIPFLGLKLGKHHYDFRIGNDFIESFGYEDFEKINVDVNLILEKKATHLELNFSHVGLATVPCDSTNQIFDLPISGNLRLIVKFGEEYNDDNEDMLVLPFSEFQLDVKQYIYEMIVLSIPVKRVHPDLINDDDLLEDEDLDFLDNEDLDIFDSIEDDEEDFVDEIGESDEIESIEKNNIIDPRWEKLKQLLTDK